jgi:N-acetylmuramoyl-L-alanine amidase
VVVPRRAVLASSLLLAAFFAFSHSLLSQQTALTVVSKDGRRTLATTVQNEQDFVALDDLAAMFQLTVREDALGVTVAYKGKTVVLTVDQPLASVSGRLVSLPATPIRNQARRWLVPAEFISRALALIYDARLDLRRPARLLLVGDIRAPRVQMRYEAVGTGARLTIDAAPRAGSAVSQDNDRIAIKFDADLLDIPNNGLALTAQSTAQGIVQAVRLADATTIEVDLGPRFSSFRAASQQLDNATRLVIDLTAATVAEAAPAPAPGATSAASTPGAAPAPAAPAPPPDLSALTQTPSSVRTIVIDPGHGGDDEGVKGPAGTKEKDLTLALARRVKAAIESRLGIRVLLTRDDDRRVSIDDRTSMANNNKSDLFISLHANASFRPSVAGGSIYSAAFEPGAAQAARALAPERVPAIGGGSREIEFVPWDFAQSAHIEESDALAKLLQAQLRDRIPLTARPIDSAPLRVLESANMPAILIEVGYLTNPAQETQLLGAEFQNPFVQGVLEAIVRFRDALDEKRRPAAGGAGR